MNPYSPKDRQKLFRAIENDWRRLEWVRRTRREQIENYVGDRYGDDAKQRELYVFLMLQTAEAYQIALVSNRPRGLVESDDPELMPFAYRFQKHLNLMFEKTLLEETLAEGVMQAFFAPCAVFKTCLVKSNPIDIGGQKIDPGKFSVRSLSWDNYCHDLSVPSERDLHYACDSYEIDVDDLEGDDRFDRDAVSAYWKWLGDSYNQGDPSAGEDPVANLAGGQQTQSDKPTRCRKLADVWLPREGKVATWPVRDGMALVDVDPLSVVEWTGSDAGIYRRLVLSMNVPDNTIPLSMAHSLFHLDELYNNLFRKMAGGAKRHKRVHGYEAGAEDSVGRVKGAISDQFVKMKRDSFQTVEIGGISQAMFGFSLQVKDMFDRMGGNVPAMAGLGPQSETASQDQMIHSQVSRREAAMQSRVTKVTQEIMGDLGRLMWNDQSYSARAWENLYGTGIHVPMDWAPGQRDGLFYDFNFKIEPYSMKYQSPSEKLAILNGFLDRMMQFGPMLESQGGMVDIQELAEQFAELTGNPRIKRLVKFGTPPVDPRERDLPTMMPNTTRNYTRKSLPASNSQTARDQEALSMASQSPQQDGGSGW